MTKQFIEVVKRRESDSFIHPYPLYSMYLLHMYMKLKYGSPQKSNYTWHVDSKVQKPINSEGFNRMLNNRTLLYKSILCHTVYYLISMILCMALYSGRENSSKILVRHDLSKLLKCIQNHYSSLKKKSFCVLEPIWRAPNSGAGMFRFTGHQFAMHKLLNTEYVYNSTNHSSANQSIHKTTGITKTTFCL
jgi:hypothetical protein